MTSKQPQQQSALLSAMSLLIDAAVFYTILSIRRMQFKWDSQFLHAMVHLWSSLPWTHGIVVARGTSFCGTTLSLICQCLDAKTAYGITALNGSIDEIVATTRARSIWKG